MRTFRYEALRPCELAWSPLFRTDWPGCGTTGLAGRGGHWAARNSAKKSATTGGAGGMRKAPRRGRWVIRSSTHLGPDLARAFPGLGCTVGSGLRPDRRYLHNTHVPRNSGRTTSLSFSTAPGGSGSHSCPSGTRSSWRCYTWEARSTACGCGPALPYPPPTRYSSDGTDPAGSAQFLAGSFRTTPCDGTSEGSRRDTYSPTSRGIGSANLSWRSSCPTGAFLTEERPKFTPETPEPLGVSPPEAVDLLRIKNLRRNHGFPNFQKSRKT